MIVMPAVGRDAPLCYSNNSNTERLVPEKRDIHIAMLEETVKILPASSREAGIEEVAGSKVQRCLPCRQPHFASLVLKVWIGAEHHLVALGLAGGGPRD